MTETGPFFSEHDTVVSQLETRAVEHARSVVLYADGEGITYDALNRRINRAARALSAIGAARGAHVAVMLPHVVDHVVVFFALMKLGAVQVPINVHLRGEGLAYILDHSAPALLIADRAFGEALMPVLQTRQALSVLWRGEDGLAAVLGDPDDGNPGVPLRDGDLRAILYTSGTTGAPKGVEMTDRMYRAAALGSAWIGDIRPGSVLHFWDPIYHVFGSEVLVLAAMRPLTLLMVPRFSASRFWSEAQVGGASHVHFVGGVLQLLLKQPASPLDRAHGVRIAWGGGCPVDTWRAFEDRFGVQVREGYGMTETSSFCTINTEGHVGSVGRAVAYFDVQVVDETGKPCMPGHPGELVVREREPGVLIRSYYDDPKATAAALRDGWLHTGDLAHADAQGRFFFHGRRKDSLRRRGENISAWEVERLVDTHPLVEESALVGVVNEFGDEDLKLFVKCRSDGLTSEELISWCRPRMAAFQVPRFVAFVDGFRKTPTQRIQKQFLSRATDDCWDAESGGQP